MEPCLVIFVGAYSEKCAHFVTQIIPLSLIPGVSVYLLMRKRFQLLLDSFPSENLIEIAGQV